MPTSRTRELTVRPAEGRSSGLIRDILCAAAGAGLASGAVAAGVARSEGDGALQPLNATSHWLHGAAAGRVRRLDGAHTGVGVATHLLSALFWAVPYAVWLRRARRRGTGEVVGGALGTAAVALAVDYLVMPRRLTPGWELVVGRSGVAAAFLGLGLGLAGGALVSRGVRR